MGRVCGNFDIFIQKTSMIHRRYSYAVVISKIPCRLLYRIQGRVLQHYEGGHVRGVQRGFEDLRRKATSGGATKAGGCGRVARVKRLCHFFLVLWGKG